MTTYVGNPPFQNREQQGKTQHKLWIKFTQTIYDQMKFGDKLLWITPQSWGSPNNKVLKIFKESEVKYVRLDTAKHFPQVGSTFSNYLLTKVTPTEKHLTEVINESSRFSFSFPVLDYVPSDVCGLSLSIHHKIMGNQNEKLQVKHDYVTNHNILLKKSDTLSKVKTPKHVHPVFHTNRQVWYSSIDQPCASTKKVMWTRSGYTKPFYDDGQQGITDMGYYVAVADRAQGEKLAANLNTDLIQYIFSTAKWSGFGNERVFAALPEKLMNCSPEDICSAFDITLEEQEYINKYLHPVKSRSKTVRNKKESEIRSQERSDNLGEVFTPAELVNEMLDTLPEDSWDQGEKFIDPACGNGNFLVGVIKKKIEKGSDILKALSTTYGIDIMEDNIAECRRRILHLVVGDQEFINPLDYREHAEIIKRNIRCADSLSQPIGKILETWNEKEV